ncbi:MAG: efflux RND transporter periplasmic adaptor subunit, partial [Gemmatimonadales bacterium]
MAITRGWRWAGVAVIVALAVWFGVARTRATDVDVATVTSGPLTVTVDEAGTTRVRSHADVNAPVGGRWVPLVIRAGDPVRAGALLGNLYPAPLDASALDQARAALGSAEAALREAETRVTAARSALDEATRTLSRTKRVADAGGVSPQDLERAVDAVTARKSEFDGAQLRVSAATYDRDRARAVVSPSGVGRGAIRIVAPVGGRVLRVFEEHERVVAPGTPLAEVGDQRDLEAVIPMLTTDAARVNEGAAVAMTFDQG